jgi:ectoine hydroxylase-related dioxygenase (phytanoyl-CoA dioxygenase family)
MDQPYLTPKQQEFFRVFGYLIVPAILRDEIAWMREEFDRLLCEPDGAPSNRAIVPFVESSPRLRTLLDHPVLERVIADVLGEEFTYVSSDGAFRHGDTNWHPDGSWPTIGSFAKVAIYLEQYTRETGSLRVIPGSHRLTGDHWAARDAARAEELWGIPQSEVPAVALTPAPGDVIIFDHNLMHGAFGGAARRMFTLNVGRQVRSDEDRLRLRKYLGIHIPRWSARVYRPETIAEASPRRLRHMTEALLQEPHVPELLARAERDRIAQEATA